MTPEEYKQLIETADFGLPDPEWEYYEIYLELHLMRRELASLLTDMVNEDESEDSGDDLFNRTMKLRDRANSAVRLWCNEPEN